MEESFGKRMARLREEREYQKNRRLRNAIKRVASNRIWTINLDREIQGAVRTLQSLNMKAELRYEGGEMRIYAVKYEEA